VTFSEIRYIIIYGPNPEDTVHAPLIFHSHDCTYW